MDSAKVIKQWLYRAKRDMRAAKILFEGKSYPQCLFWCHLVIEKMLKALVIRKTGKQAPYIHDLQRLYHFADLQIFDKEDYEILAEFTLFNQMGRYHDITNVLVKRCAPAYVRQFLDITHRFYTCLLKEFQLKK